MIRSFVVVGIGAAALFLLQLLAEAYAAAFTNVPWAVSLAVLGVILAVLGGAAYRFLRGSVVARLILVALIVVIANGAAEVVMGSDQAYPRLGLWLIIPYVLACWIGAAVAIGLARWGSGRTGNQGR